MKAIKKLEDCALFLLQTPGWNIPFGAFPIIRMILDRPISPRSPRERTELRNQCENLYTRRCREWKDVLLARDQARRNFSPHARNITEKDIIFLRVQGIDPEINKDP